jgi:hypothetical protein
MRSDDSLLEFLDVYRLPALIFDSDSRLVYSNPSLDAWSAHSVIAQVTGLIRDFSHVPPRIVTTLGEDADRTLAWTVTRSRERVILLAQDDPVHDVLARPGPSTLPPLRIPWHEQKRFACMKTGGGEMGDLIRNFDWASTSLGPLETWPQALVSLIGTIIRTPMPLATYVGEEYLVLYNDAFRPILGPTKHPHVLGQHGKQVWGEIWDSIEEPLQQTLHGHSYYRENDMLFFSRLSDGDNPLQEVRAYVQLDRSF